MTEDTMAQPTKTTISKHLRQLHGYDINYAVSAHETTLLSEHDRIHAVLTNLDHTHETQ